MNSTPTSSSRISTSLRTHIVVYKNTASGLIVKEGCPILIMIIEIFLQESTEVELEGISSLTQEALGLKA